MREDEVIVASPLPRSAAIIHAPSAAATVASGRASGGEIQVSFANSAAATGEAVATVGSTQTGAGGGAGGGAGEGDEDTFRGVAVGRGGGRGRGSSLTAVQRASRTRRAS